MKILNIMLSRNLGGIQQAFLDYDAALRTQGITVINVTSHNAKINDAIGCNFKLLNLGPWDIFSRWQLRRIIKMTGATSIIVHGNRAISFANDAKTKEIPLIGVAHNYTLKALRECDYIIAITEHMQEFLIKNNFKERQIIFIPNMIKIKDNTLLTRTYQAPVRIGSMARFVPKKGIDIFMQAMHKLKSKGYNFKAIIGGDGEEKQKLQSLTQTLHLNNVVSFTGWVTNTDNFFNDIDIFCLPSVHEPFGIILLEAMRARLPIISTSTEGPREIIRDKLDGLLCEPGSSDDLAEKIAYLIDNPDKAKQLASSGYLRVRENYDIRVVGTKLVESIKSITNRHCKKHS